MCVRERGGETLRGAARVGAELGRAGRGRGEGGGGGRSAAAAAAAERSGTGGEMSAGLPLGSEPPSAAAAAACE